MEDNAFMEKSFLQCVFIMLVSLLFICFLALWVELRSSMTVVLNRGGLCLDISLGINGLRLIGIRIRLMPGHKPRAWIQNLVTGKYSPIKALVSVYQKMSRKVDVPLGSMVQLGLRLIIRRVEVKARIGIRDDAAATALLCGFAAAFFETVRAFGTHGNSMPDGFVIVNPDFGQDRFSLQMKCIIGLKALDVLRDVMRHRAPVRKRTAASH